MSQELKDVILQPIKGMPDIFGQDLLLMNTIISSIRKIAEINAYSEIILPVMEHSSVFHRTLGESSDIVNKETYNLFDRNEQQLTLRPEFTASICRAVFSNKWQQQLPLRLLSLGPLFRYERPQRGRYRQFHQASFEFFGVSSVDADIETIAMAYNILDTLKLTNSVKLEINTIGGKETRSKYILALKEYYTQHQNALSEDSKRRLGKNPLRILDSKEKRDIEINKDAPNFFNFISAEELEYYNLVKEKLTILNIKYVENPHLVRGLDYYNDIVFEFTTEKLGAQSAVIAGGRYDGLTEIMGNISIPAIGFAVGIERLIELLKINNFAIEAEKPLYLLPIGENAQQTLLSVMNLLRNKGIKCIYDYKNNLAKNMKRANNLDCKYILIFGDEELKQNTYKLKNLATGEEKSLTIDEIISISTVVK